MDRKCIIHSLNINVNKRTLGLLFLISFTVGNLFSQLEFSATTGLPMDPNSGTNFQASGTTITNLGTKAVEIEVSGVGTLDNLVNQLAEIHIDLQAGGGCGGTNLQALACAIVAPDNSTFAWVTMHMGHTTNWTQPNKKISLSFRTATSCLQTLPNVKPATAAWVSLPNAEYDNWPDLPAANDVNSRSGFFRTHTSNGDLEAVFNGVDADGTWTLRFSNGINNKPCVTAARLVFKDPTVYDYTNDGHTCATAIDWNGEPACLSTTGKMGSPAMPGFNGGHGMTATSPVTIGGQQCDWNASNDNDSWLRFTPADEDVCITISGILDNLQSVIVKPTSPTSCTDPHPGGGNDTRWELMSCPRQDIYQAFTGTVRNHNHCFTAIPGETYYLVVDGASGAESDYFVSGLTGFSIPTVDCPADFSVCISEDPFTLTGATPVGGTYSGTGVTANEFDPAAAGVGAHTITYDFGGDDCTFDITVVASPLIDTPTDVIVCDTYTLPALINGAYYETSGGIDPIAVGTEITSTQTIFVYNETGGSPNCTNEHEFEVTIINSPDITDLVNQEHCDSYTLPVIGGTNLTGNEAYYTGANGTGTSYGIGDVISFADFGSYPVTLYIYDVTATTPTCSDEESFELTLIETPTYTLDPTDPLVCDGDDGTILIEGLNPNFDYTYSYTDGAVTVGPITTTSNGSGQILIEDLEAGAYTITVSVLGATETCSGSGVQTTLNNPGAPQIDAYALVEVCDEYTVPPITGNDLTGNEAYYDAPDATGNVVAVGTVITSSITLYAYDIDGMCVDEKVLNITINNTPELNPIDDIEGCDQLRLPSPIGGTNLTGNVAYYSEPNGQGTMYLPGQTIEYADLNPNPMTFYAYDETGTIPNCWDEVSFTVAIYLTPEINPLADQEECDSYTLPAITGDNLTGNEAYYDGLFGAGTSYSAGQTINFTDYPNYPITLYMYDETGTSPNCNDQQAFELILYPTPNFNLVGQDPSECDFEDGQITIVDLEASMDYSVTYTDGVVTEGPLVVSSNGDGEIVLEDLGAGGYWVTVEVDGGTCASVTEEITLNNPGAPQIDAYTPVTVCDSYSVPAITGQNLTGDEAYYDALNGGGNIIPVGTIITESTTLYAYDVNGDCSDQKTLVITINYTPVLNPIDDVEICDAYRLPEIEGDSLSGNEAYYTEPNGGGDMHLAGTTIEFEGMPSNPLTLYVYDETGTNPNCLDEVSFILTIHPTPNFELVGVDPSACDYEDGEISITGLEPTTDYSVTYTVDGASNGPTPITSTVEGDIMLEDLSSGAYVVTVELIGGTCDPVTENIVLNNPGAPQIDAYAPVEACDSYVVPEITGDSLTGDEAYYDAPNGTGDIVPVGTVVTTSTTIYAYDINGDCSDEEALVITIHHTPVLETIEDVEVCGEFTFPVIEGDNLVAPIYTTSPEGQGDTYTSGTTISVDEFTSYPTTIYVYDEVAGSSCSAELSFELIIRALPTATITGAGGTYCSYQKPSDIVVEMTGTPDWSLTFTLDGETYTVTSATSPMLLPGEAGVYELVEISDAYCTNDASGAASAEIIIKPTPEPPVVTADSDYCSNSEFEVMLAEGDGQITWYMEDNETPYAVGNSTVAVDQIGETTYSVTATLDGCESLPTEVVVNVIGCDIVIPEAFTPNGDGYNDVFYIENLEAYPNTRVIIFNRWGAELYVSDDYPNNWDGRSENQFNVGGNIVPEGTYFYLIELGGPENHELYGKIYKGWVYIKP